MIIPTYNERENLPLIVGRVRKACPRRDPVVDDGSPDGTGQLADEMAAAEPDRIHVMHRTANGSAAYLAAFAQPGTRLHRPVEMDADGSHAPSSCTACWTSSTTAPTWRSAPRYVDGGTVRNWPWRRLVLSKTANGYARTLLGVDIHDITAGYRAYRHEVLEKLDLSTVESKGYCFQVDLTWRAISNGFTVAEAPITFTERELGVSKMSGSNIREAMTKVAQWGIGPDEGPPPRRG